MFYMPSILARVRPESDPSGDNLVESKISEGTFISNDLDFRSCPIDI